MNACIIVLPLGNRKKYQDIQCTCYMYLSITCNTLNPLAIPAYSMFNILLPKHLTKYLVWLLCFSMVFSWGTKLTHSHIQNDEEFDWSLQEYGTDTEVLSGQTDSSLRSSPWWACHVLQTIWEIRYVLYFLFLQGNCTEVQYLYV